MERSEEESSQNTTGNCESEPAYQAGIASLDILCLVLGQPMSVRLLWITQTSKHLDVLNCNLALFQILQYIIFYFHLVFLFTSSFIKAKFYKFIFVYIQVGGPMQLCFICVERFIAVIYPTYFPLLKKYRCREICAVVVWILSVTLAVSLMFDEKSKSLENFTHFLPMCLMATLSCIIVLTSVKVAKVLRNPAVGKESIHPVKKRAFITICVTSAATMTCYIFVLGMEKYKDVDEFKYKCYVVPLCIFFLSTASLVHPLFYLYAKGEFSCRRCTKNPG